MDSMTHLDGLMNRYPALEALRGAVADVAQLLIDTYLNGGKVLVCGNGGSAADSEHIVGELMKGFLRKRPVSDAHRRALEAAFPHRAGYLCGNLQESLPAISLCSQTALMTAFMNDVAADMVFAQQVFGYGRAGDVLIAISTSGNSSNIVNAAQVAAAMGLRTVGMTGESGGALKGLCTLLLNAPATETFVVQEYHVAMYHAICAMVEAHFFAA